ncbi:MAG TPA: 30S ribosomal protein S4 [Candidatus Fermentibacter sp.]|nr:30S ribosomal protein S4 [Candidatus Fermentibacter sp.]
MISSSKAATGGPEVRLVSTYRGPRLRKVRSLGVMLPGLTHKAARKRTSPPGEAGGQHRRRRVSVYRMQLSEKQKIRYNYGLSEKQLEAYFQKAASLPGETGVNLLQLVERRLDNVVARSGFASTIPAARQLVSHGHITVNGHKVDIASYQVGVGDIISLKESSRDLKVIVDNITQGRGIGVPAYLEVDPKSRKASMKSLPAREDITLEVQERMVVEFYSK